MSLHPQAVYTVPEDTARVARAAFPKGNPYLRMHDELGRLFADQDFAALFPTRGQPALAPAQLALVTADAIRRGPDRPPGRRRGARAGSTGSTRCAWSWTTRASTTRCCASSARGCWPARQEALLFDAAAGALPGGRAGAGARAAAHRLDRRRWRRSGPSIAWNWSARRCATRCTRSRRSRPTGCARSRPPAWAERYGRRLEEYRLPQDPPRGRRWRAQIGADGRPLLEAVHAPAAPAWLREVPAVETLRH